MARIETPEAALQEMLAWANGEKTHADVALAAPPDKAVAMFPALVQADAAEVQKWATVADTLARLVGFVVPEDGIFADEPGEPYDQP